MPGRVRSSEHTRADILSAAREQFAARGFTRTTTRSVAAAVGVDPALVTRYFGSKEALFGEAVRLVIRYPQLGSLSRTEVGRSVVEVFLDTCERDVALLGLLRTAPSSPDTARLLTTALIESSRDAFAAIVPDRLEERVALIAAQLIGYAFVRYVLEVPALVTMSREDLVGWLSPLVTGLLFDPRPSPR